MNISVREVGRGPHPALGSVMAADEVQNTA